MDMKNRSDQIHRDEALLFEAYKLLVRYYDQEYKVTLISDKLDIHRAIGNITIKIKSGRYFGVAAKLFKFAWEDDFREAMSEREFLDLIAAIQVRIGEGVIKEYLKE